MLLLRPPVVRAVPEIRANNPSKAPTSDAAAAPVPPPEPASALPGRSTTEPGGQAAWRAAVAYVGSKGVGSAHADFAAMVLLKITRDFSVVRLDAGREVAVIHPAFSLPDPALSELSRATQFSKIAALALQRSAADRFSLFAVGQELVARSPSWRHEVPLAGILPEPWCGVLKTIGKQAMSAPNLNHFHYQAKIFLISPQGATPAEQGMRMMIQRHRVVPAQRVRDEDP